MKCAEAVSTSSNTTEAAASVADELSRSLGSRVELVFVFATMEHADALEAIRDRLAAGTRARHVVGCTVSGAIGAGREFEAGPSLAALAIDCEPGDVVPFVSTLERAGDDEARIRDLPLDELARESGRTAVIFPDPFSFPIEPVLRFARDHGVHSPWVGGIASGGSGPGRNRLICDDVINEAGAVGVVLGGTIVVEPIVSQGCRPIGRHFVVTKGRSNVIEELGGVPALTRLHEVIDSLDESEKTRFVRGIHIGRVVDEYKSSFGRGDFLVRSVIGVDRSTASLAINDQVRRGSTIQFMLRDPPSATEELEFLLDRARRRIDAPPVRGALLFSCNGRGTHLFAESDHDVGRVRAASPSTPTVGFFAAGEIGPVGADSHVHGFTASVGLLRSNRD